MMTGKVVGLGFEIISNLDSYFLMTVSSDLEGDHKFQSKKYFNVQFQSRCTYNAMLLPDVMVQTVHNYLDKIPVRTIIYSLLNLRSKLELPQKQLSC